MNEEKYDAEKVLDTRLSGGSLLQRLTAPLRIKPDIFLLGVQKGGTSSLYKALVQHQAVLTAKRKEIFYFGNDMYYNRGLNWYRQFFALRVYQQWYDRKKGVHSVSIDASTNTFDHPLAPERVHALAPRAKLIVLLRDPVKRAYSHYLMSKKNGYEFATFAEALRLENARLNNIVNQPLYTKGNNNAFQRLGYRTRGLYVNYLKQWYSVFSPGQILVLNSEAFAADTENVYNKVIDFLGLEKQQGIKLEKTNITPPYEPMDQQVQKELEDFYAPYNRELFELIGQHYNWSV